MTQHAKEIQKDEASLIVTALQNTRKFDLTILGVVLTVLGMAAILWLQGYFVTKERYERDQSRVEQTLQTISTDIKTLLKDHK